MPCLWGGFWKFYHIWRHVEVTGLDNLCIFQSKPSNSCLNPLLTMYAFTFCLFLAVIFQIYFRWPSELSQTF